MAVEVAVRVQKEMLEEVAKSQEDAKAKRAALSQRLEHFEERAQAWTTLKEKHLARICILEEELDAARGTAPSSAPSSHGRRGEGSTGSGRSAAELEKLLIASELERVALAQKVEDTGTVD